MKPRFEPALGGRPLRFSLAAAALIASVWQTSPPEGSARAAAGIPLAAAWLLSAWLTDKYRHKYPQRYYTYVLASHAKAAAVLAVVLVLMTRLDAVAAHAAVIWRAALLFTALDAVLALPRRRMRDADRPAVSAAPPPAAPPPAPPVEIDAAAAAAAIAAREEIASVPGLAAFVGESLKPGTSGLSSVHVVRADDLDSSVSDAAVLVQLKPMNALRRLNRFLMQVPAHVPMGGYFVFRYRPLDDELEALKRGRRGPALWFAYSWHFLRYRGLPKIPVLEQLYFSKPLSVIDSWLYRRMGQRRRVISRAEMWGRMYYWGFEVLGERQIDGEYWVVTRRFRTFDAARQPSFFMVARLTKVGLDGRLMHLHKVRTMYPFSEFVQERLYQDHGLSTTGKFRNDFRLTDYGRFLRKYWLDELPQVFDWLRGEVKLVGMRATSPHFLGLYPTALYDLYVQTKPGLIPPIFDANTSGFDDIVRIEFDYLEAYQRSPFLTDARCLLKTAHDIVIRGVRSK